MPELPEVETTRRGIIKPLKSQQFTKVIIRQHQLRWPIPKKLPQLLCEHRLENIKRRGKYLLFEIETGHMLLHLGMSGRLHVLENPPPAAKHDHVDFIFANNFCLRYTDPRRFGSILWTAEDVKQHRLLKNLGPEPLHQEFNSDYLYAKTQHKKVAIKALLMNSQIVVGVGNIYANEALFLAGIKPQLKAGKISRQRLDKLVEAIKQILKAAIKAGGTTLKDFRQSSGKPGYFKQALQVYARKDQACPNCQRPIKQIILNQRTSYYCSHCQH